MVRVTFRYSQPARQDIDRGIGRLQKCGQRCSCFFPFGLDAAYARRGAGDATDNRQVMPDDHSELVPPLPIPNRTVKRLCADDSAATSVKVGHRQAVIRKPPSPAGVGGFCFGTVLFKSNFTARFCIFYKLFLSCISGAFLCPK